MRIWRLGLLAIGLLIATAGLSEAASSQVMYRLYHFESGSWVRYRSWDSFPAGGDVGGTNLWKYDYTVANFSLSGTGINTWYAFFNSDNVLCATNSLALAPSLWTVQQQGPVAPNYNWKERFRTTTTSSFITAGNSLTGFSIQFTWQCHSLPGAQNYDAVTSGGSESSVTLEDPEPVPAQITTWGAVKSLHR